jgi:hypothetical protein
MRPPLPLHNNGVYILMRLNGIVGQRVSHSGHELLNRADVEQKYLPVPGAHPSTIRFGSRV